MKLALGLLWWFITTYPLFVFGIVGVVAGTVLVAALVGER